MESKIRYNELIYKTETDPQTYKQIYGYQREKELGRNKLGAYIFAWEIPWTEEPGGLSPWGRRVGHDCATSLLGLADINH